MSIPPKMKYKRLDTPCAKGIFGKLIPAPTDAAIFHWIRLYVTKTMNDNWKAAQAICDNSTTGDKTIMAVLHSFLVLQAGDTDTFTKTDLPKHTHSIQVNKTVQHWWNTCFPHNPLHPDAVIPICRNLQGHPKASQPWRTHLDKILHTNLNLHSPIHTPCLSCEHISGKLLSAVQKIDGFDFPCMGTKIYDSICDTMDRYLSIFIMQYCLMKHNNGIDIRQTLHSSCLNVHTHLQKIFTAHSWPNLPRRTTPISSEGAYMETLEHTELLSLIQHVNTANTFQYRGPIGELMQPMITACPDISFPVVELSQFSTPPTTIHCDAIFSIFYFLFHESIHDIICTRPQPLSSLPYETIQVKLSSPNVRNYDHTYDTKHLSDNSDSGWAMNTQHYHCISGLVFPLAGRVVTWKRRIQPLNDFRIKQALPKQTPRALFHHHLGHMSGTLMLLHQYPALASSAPTVQLVRSEGGCQTVTVCLFP